MIDSSDVLASVYCVAKIQTEVSMLGSTSPSLKPLVSADTPQLSELSVPLLASQLTELTTYGS